MKYYPGMRLKPLWEDSDFILLQVEHGVWSGRYEDDRTISKKLYHYEERYLNQNFKPYEADIIKSILDRYAS